MSVGTAVVLCGGQSDLLSAEEHLTRAVLYIPRRTEKTRSSGRSRSMITRVVQQWPGYAFLLSDHLQSASSVLRRCHLQHMLPGVITTVPLSQLYPSRVLESTSALRARDPTLAPPVPEPPSTGDLVAVTAGQWGEFHGIVVEVSRGMVVVDVPHSPVCVRADPAHVRVVDRKKMTCLPGFSAL